MIVYVRFDPNGSGHCIQFIQWINFSTINWPIGLKEASRAEVMAYSLPLSIADKQGMGLAGQFTNWDVEQPNSGLMVFNQFLLAS